MPRLQSLGLIAAVQFALMTVAFFVMMAAAYVISALDVVSDTHSVEAHKIIRELSIRGALLFWIAASCLIVYLYQPARAWVLQERWPLLMLILFALGALIAMADPKNVIQAEDNWIRYTTAGALFAASAISLVCAFGPNLQVQDRLLGIGFCVLFGAGGADELLQFHERASEFAMAVLPSEMPAIEQDYVTLGIGLIGVLTLVAVLLFRHFSGWAAEQFRQPRYQWPLYLFGFSVFSFLLAQAFDSYDVYLIELFDYVRLKTTGTVPAATG